MTKKPYTGRDWLMVRIVCGVTKSAVHTDKKKAVAKKLCRRRIRLKGDEG